jgi:hypothetical protein
MRTLTRNVILPVVLFSLMLLNTSFVDLFRDKVEFKGYFGKEILFEGKNYFCTERGDSISIDMCRFYISDVEFYSGEMPVAGFDYKLIDLFDTSSCSFYISGYSHGPITEIRFKLGIDSITNVAGVGKGDLDPTKGMYWTWQSGYINMKIEGKSKLCRTNRGTFQYHIGGYSAPTNSLREIVLKAESDNGNFQINVDVEKFFAQLDMEHTTHVMSPSAKSQELADQSVKMFSINK